ncbi:MAG TPA: hypothetical protein VGQ09_21495 [Chitinophagaceae bacterium]|jgi:hypothetical protein|nr:hypothetical protein [Chitinophagaceae bacterium]
MRSAILQYIDALQAADYNKIIALFSEEGVVHSPLYGDLSAKEFFKKLSSDTQCSKITMLNIFSSIDRPNVYSAHFKYEWTLKDNSETNFDCVDIFVFNEISKIKEMTIIYDTHKIRGSFENL